MRIALLTAHYPPAAVPCGVGDYTRCLRSALEALGHQCAVITSVRSRSPEANVFRVADHWGAADFRIVCRLIRTIQPDAVVMQYTPEHYGFGATMKFLPMWVRWALRGTVMVTTLHTLVGGRWRSKPYAALLAAGSHGLVSTHAEVSDLFRRRLPWWAHKMREIPIGSNIPRPSVESAQAGHRLRRRFGLDEGAAVLGTFGFPAPGKGLETLIHAVGDLSRGSRMVHLVCIGETREEDGAHRAALEGLAQRLGVTKQIHWLGGLPPQDASDLLAGADAYVVPYDEGASLRRGTLMAGFRVGVPIVTTTPRYPDPSLLPGETIFVVSPQDHEALAHGIGMVLKDRGLQERLRRGMAAVGDRFEWPAIAAAHVEFIGQLRGGR